MRIVRAAGIRLDNLSRVDLNLLVTLNVLLAERNVTRAAARLNRSQPAVSVQLARLRELFGDRLLLPGPRGMTPTARAIELSRPLEEALEVMRAAISPSRAFDPSTANHTWKVAASDYAELAILLPTLQQLRREAPATRLAVLEINPSRMAQRAEDGSIDLGLQTMDTVPSGLHAQSLYFERYVLVSRPGHPRLRRRPTLKQFCALDHAVVSPSGGGFAGATDEVLATTGLVRRVVLSVPHFLALMAIVANTDMVAMLPARSVRGAAALQVTDSPLEVPGFEMGMVWHDRLHRDPAHGWLREQIARAATA